VIFLSANVRSEEYDWNRGCQNSEILPAHNWPLCAALTKRHRNCKKFAGFVTQRCS